MSEQALSLTEQQDLQVQLANCKERLVEARQEAWMHRQNWERALQLLSIFAPPDLTEILADGLVNEWIEAVA